MKVSLNWLKQYTKVDLSLEELVAKIGAQLGAVEEIIDLRGKYDGIKIVQITEAKDHPNADKLNVYQMTDGRDQVQVVSGDRTLQVGDKVAWLAPGLTVPGTWGTAQPVVLESRPLRGEISHGMFGSGKELDINDDHEGVLKLDTAAHPGSFLKDAYDLDDVVIDIENKMFTHRPDCFGLLGVAREVAGIQGQQFTSPDWYLLEAGKHLQAEDGPLSLSVDNQLPMLCPVYRTAVLSQMRVAPSPLLLQTYLKRVGIRPINNVVDVTNWLMYLTGQPLHAFDYDKLAATDGMQHPAIVVRNPKPGETITLLDGKTIEPHKDAILICSRHKPVAIGGIMGGRETEVDAQTTTVVIESANFSMYSIRKTSMEHGIFTDAVTRFGKGQSPEQCGVVLAQAVTMLQQNAGAKLASELGIEEPKRPAVVQTSVAFINQRLGTDLGTLSMQKLLENVEFEVAHREGQLTITPPFWRTDIEIAEDIVEEVGRLHGFGDLSHSLPTRPIDAVRTPSLEILKSDIRSLLVNAGNNELQTYSFVSAKLLEKSGQDGAPAYRLRNALSPELHMVRTSLLPSILDKVHLNHKAGYDVFGLFEIGKSHNKHEVISEPGGPDDQLPRERLSLAYVFSAEPKSLQVSDAAFYQAKYELTYLLKELRMPTCTFEPLTAAQLQPWWLQNLAKLFEPRRAAVISVAGVPLGIIGEFTRQVAANFKLPAFAAGFELDIKALHGISRPRSTYQPLPKYPATEQDICLRVKDDVTYAQLKATIESCFAHDQRLQATISPLDIYQKAGDDAYKQITYRLRLQHHDRTLTTAETNTLLASVADRASHEHGAVRI